MYSSLLWNRCLGYCIGGGAGAAGAMGVDQEIGEEEAVDREGEEKT
jgi:hypothetical protein